MKTKVAVEVNLMRVIFIDVEHDENEDPCDLTYEERDDAMSDARFGGGVDFGQEIVRVRLASPSEDK